MDTTHSSDSPLDRRILLGAAGLAGIAALAAGRAHAGPLNPPAGAVASTAKPLGEIEPRTAVNATNTPAPPGADTLFRITQPGSYYLTGNIIGVAGKSGIEIASSSVTLDLCGFTVQGVAASGDGIFASSSSSGITVLNGTVKGWGASGVTFFNGVTASRISGINAIGNSTGIAAESATTITDCAASANTTGIIVIGTCVVSNCLCSGNTGDGIQASNRNRITGNSCHNNSGSGILLTGGLGLGGNRVEDNACSNGAVGYRVENALNILVRNTAFTHSTAAWVVSNQNYLQVLSPRLAPGFTGPTGGLPLAPSGYDPNANFTLG